MAGSARADRAGRGGKGGDVSERGRYVLEALESDCWILVQPLDMWSYQRGDCWTVGDYGPFQLMETGDTFEAARDAFCRALISNAEFAERRGEMYDDYMRRVNKSHAASGQSWQNTATNERNE